MKIISLGWGVQSFTLAAMVALGELEPVDYAIHADTTHEFSGTYEFAAKWTPWLAERGVRVVTVANKENRVTGSRFTGEVHIPAFMLVSEQVPVYDTIEEWDDSTQSFVTYQTTRIIGYKNREINGQTHRQCTGHWKIEPMRRWIQANRNKEPVEQWLGISLDEYQRMRDSDVKYITHRWPLIEKRMTRHDCEKWLTAHDLEIPPKSACSFCPFHNTAEWRKIKNSPSDWKKAVEVDEEIRKAYPPYDLFVHPSRKPLAEVDFRTAEEKGQLSLWDSECSGICGV